ncbi:MAG: AraC family transcriptional regulator ligand-binding domain-containing protein [Methylophilus sp.]|nr:AraC family transcriptional regulator ligand-binding domain-containing protein [Methylophilus sp.]
MRIQSNYFERDTGFIAAHHQPAIMLDLAMSRDVDSHLLLRGTQLFLEDMLTGHKLISPAQFLTLLSNGQKLLKGEDISFLFGQQILPGFNGPASQVFNHALNLRQALIHLCEYHTLLSPLCTPRYFESESHFFIYWLDNCGAGALHTFLIEAHMTAVTRMASKMSQQTLPWRFNFTHEEPRYVEQYWVHLNEEVSFNQQLNMMSIPLEYANQTWSQSALVSLQLATLGSKMQLHDLGWQQSFLDTLYDYLRQNIQQNLQLDTVATAFGMSSASLKRKLLKHDTHFQEQLDLARKHVALYLYQIKGYQHHDVADYLRFNDINNFRRAFKRWTGLPPGRLLQANCF